MDCYCISGGEGGGYCAPQCTLREITLKSFYLDGSINNAESLPLLAKQALTFAQAGADIVAPSDMMDGRVYAIKKILAENGLRRFVILYSNFFTAERIYIYTQGSKGIMQWPINSCTSPMMIHKIASSVDYH